MLVENTVFCMCLILALYNLYFQFIFIEHSLIYFRIGIMMNLKFMKWKDLKNQTQIQIMIMKRVIQNEKKEKEESLVVTVLIMIVQVVVEVQRLEVIFIE